MDPAEVGKAPRGGDRERGAGGSPGDGAGVEAVPRLGGRVRDVVVVPPGHLLAHSHVRGVRGVGHPAGDSDDGDDDVGGSAACGGWGSGGAADVVIAIVGIAGGMSYSPN